MAVEVKPQTLPAAGVDTVFITIEETYEVEGVGKDTVTLKGTLVADRTVPLLDHGRREASWDSSFVVARFTRMNLAGESRTFGPISVGLDDSAPSFGLVQNGKCAAALAVEISMPNHDLVLRTAEPVQLHSQVKTVPPIGDERTESVRPVQLVDVRTGRSRGSLVQARVAWRELSDQRAHRVSWPPWGQGGGGAGSVDERLARLEAAIDRIDQRIR